MPALDSIHAASNPTWTTQDSDGIAGQLAQAECVSPSSHKAAAEWHPLAAELVGIMSIVPKQSASLERTTVLTWIYLNEGLMTFGDVAARVGPNINGTSQKRMARRALRGLQRLGAITVAEILSSEEAANTTEPAKHTGACPGVPDDQASGIALNTIVYITRRGMTWLQRAWHARRMSLESTRDTELEEVHELYLHEEEDGKGTEPHWLESFGNNEQAPETKTTGEVTAWMGKSISSVFQLHTAVAHPRRRR